MHTVLYTYIDVGKFSEHIMWIRCDSIHLAWVIYKSIHLDHIPWYFLVCSLPRPTKFFWSGIMPSKVWERKDSSDLLSFQVIRDQNVEEIYTIMTSIELPKPNLGSWTLFFRLWENLFVVLLGHSFGFGKVSRGQDRCWQGVMICREPYALYVANVLTNIALVRYLRSST